MRDVKSEKSDTSPPAATPAAHDTQAPEALVAFMLQHWDARPTLPVEPLEGHEHFARRRQQISGHFPGELLIVPNGHLKVRANDEYYPFRSSSNFFYLTGCQDPDSLLLLIPEGSGHRAVLFVEPYLGKTDARFFTDRVKGELWEGPCLGVSASATRYQISDTRPLPVANEVLAETLSAHPRFRLLRGDSLPLEAWLKGRIGSDAESPEQLERDRQLSTSLSELRLYKDAQELQELRRVIDSTQRGFEDVIRRLKIAKNERELEGTFFTRARIEGNWTGYNSVVASGAHACTLHWRRNNGPVQPDHLVLLDAGVEGNSLYTADITRVLPACGRFSPAQREIYELVYAAQRAAIAEVKPGNDFMDPNKAAMRVLSQGLERMGILQTSAEDALRNEHQFYKRYSLHNVSHMLGLDVHDCAQARSEVYRYGKLVPGMVLTVEPGLYFQPDDATVPARYRGIGVRIEDDLVVTASGHEILSADIPVTADEIEAWIARLWSEG